MTLAEIERKGKKMMELQEKIEKLNRKIWDMEQEQKRHLKKATELDRKIRTRRLIQIGAAFVKFFGGDLLNEDDEHFQKSLANIFHRP